MKILLLLFISCLSAQYQTEISFDAAYYRTNQTVQIEIKFAIDSGFHIYSLEKVEGPIPTSVSYDSIPFKWLDKGDQKPQRKKQQPK